MTTKALVILSGGQDSTTCLFWAKAQGWEVHAVTFDYGQRHRIELDAARKVAELAGVASHEVIEMPGILGGRSFLTNPDAEVERFASFDDMERRNAGKENKLDSSFVPMRNPLFLTIAANRAYVQDCTAMVAGLTAADFAEYGELSWEWLGGFVDAEGCFTTVNGNGYRLAIYQNDPMLLGRIGRWVQGQCPGVTFGFSVDADKRQAEITFGKMALTDIIPLLSPHLHSPLRRRQATERGVALCDEAPLSDAYVTGFWEGDGSVSSQLTRSRKGKMVAAFQFTLFQKVPAVLEAIRGFLDRGTVYQRNTQNRIWVLTISDGPLSAKLLTRMRRHMNVLGSFEKIASARHHVRLAGGGFNPPYPDCSPDFVWSFQAALDEALLTPKVSRIRIETPLLYLTKAQTVWLAQTLPGCMDALAHSHTAYDGRYPPNGSDHASVLRAHGFEEAGVPDPLVVRAVKEGLMALPATANYDTLRAA